MQEIREACKAFGGYKYALERNEVNGRIKPLLYYGGVSKAFSIENDATIFLNSLNSNGNPQWESEC